MFSTGRIRFHLKFSYFGECRFEGENIKLTTSERIITALGGPIFSLILVFLSLLALYMGNIEGDIRSLVVGILIYNFLFFFITIVPLKYPAWYKPYAGMPSDGYKVLMAVREKKE